MPTYTYHCNHCEKGTFEEVRAMVEDVSINPCPDCKNDAKQVIQISKVMTANPWKHG